MDYPLAPQAAPTVFLAEDDPNDAWLLRRALSRTAPGVVLRVTTDGRSAIESLSRVAADVGQPGPRPPNVVLLDVHLPRASGWEVLRWIKDQTPLRAVPVFVWTSLPTPEGVARAKELGAARYFSKPEDPSGYLQLAATIGSLVGD
jgi:CheY-like chemotaxis protein